MRIGIDCRTILNPDAGELAGVGHYTYYLVKYLLSSDKDNEYVLFFDHRFKDLGQFSGKNVKIRTFPFYQYKQYLPIAYSQMLVSAFLAKERLDLFHSPANIVPFFYLFPSVVTVHDLAIYKYPEFFPSGKITRQAFAAKVLIPSTLSRVKKIIAVSQNTKDDIIDLFGVPEDRIEVIYEGVVNHGKNCPNQSDFKIVQEKFGIGEKYLLFLGTIEPRKNLTALVRVFKNLKLFKDSSLADYQLIIAGGKGWKNDEFFEEMKKANDILVAKGQKPSIIYAGYVSHADKLSLIANAKIFVFPSFYEGFSLPVLEAMSMGTPVITANSSSLTEIADEHSSILIDPASEQEMQEAIFQLLSDDGLREELAINGQRRAQDFTWEECAKKTLAVYESALK